MAQKKVILGDSWAVWPSVVRITVGTEEDMAKFRTPSRSHDMPPTKAELDHYLRNPVHTHFS